jgi:hypothetical protein
MTEQVAAAQDYNPFDPENFGHGGGLWDGKTVTITQSVAKTQALTKGDGSAVLDEKTKEPVILTALFLTGISDGGDDKERHEEYSAGDKNVAAPDGKGFVDKATGGLPKFHASSNTGKLLAALKASGFPTQDLFNAATKTQHLDKLVGARFVFKGEPKIGKDGKPLKDKKGYTKTSHLPVKFVGYAAGVAAAKSSGNGSVAPAPASADALTTKAIGAVTGALAAAGGGKVTRADLVRGLAQSLQGDPDANAIIGLVVRDDFHKGKPWTYDGTHASL